MGAPTDPFDDAPTPRQSEGIERGPIWAGFADILAEHMFDVEAKCKSELDHLLLPRSGFGEATRRLVGARLQSRILEARSIAEEARHLAGAFRSWEVGDPGVDSRGTTVWEWQDLERRAKDLEASEPG